MLCVIHWRPKWARMGASSEKPFSPAWAEVGRWAPRSGGVLASTWKRRKRRRCLCTWPASVDEQPCAWAEIFFSSRAVPQILSGCPGGFRLSKIGRASRVLHPVLAHFHFTSFPGAPSSGCCFPESRRTRVGRETFSQEGPRLTGMSSGTPRDATWTIRDHLWGSRDKSWLFEDAASGAPGLLARASLTSQVPLVEFSFHPVCLSSFFYSFRYLYYFVFSSFHQILSSFVPPFIYFLSIFFSLFSLF
jgi:hypothetical protein